MKNVKHETLKKEITNKSKKFKTSIMKKIFLLVDDDSDDKELFCEALESIDPSIECYCAAHGKEALSVLKEKPSSERPHLIFLDINMPEMNGWQCLVELKKEEDYKEIPVLMYSTSSHPRDVNIALDLGALCFFTKPGDFKELKSMLEVVANHVHQNLLEAISQFNGIHAKKIFSCSDDKQ